QMFLAIIFRIESRDDPAFSFATGDTDDDLFPCRIRIPCLFESLLPFILVVKVADQQNRVNLSELLENIEDRPACSLSVWQRRFTVEMTLRPDSNLTSAVRNRCPCKMVAGGILAYPLPLRFNQRVIEPSDLSK